MYTIYIMYNMYIHTYINIHIYICDAFMFYYVVDNCTPVAWASLRLRVKEPSPGRTGFPHAQEIVVD